jgi:hypothetical protein
VPEKYQAASRLAAMLERNSTPASILPVLSEPLRFTQHVALDFLQLHAHGVFELE